MRIVIEDGATTGAAAQAAVSASVATAALTEQDAGPGPATSDATGGTSTGGEAARDGGGPPQWLLDAVSRAISLAGNVSTRAMADAADGGPGLPAGSADADDEERRP